MMIRLLRVSWLIILLGTIYTWEYDDVNLLNYAMEWSILSHYQDQVGGFKEWYFSHWWLRGRKLNSINMLNRYEEKGIEKFNDAVKFLYNQYNRIEDKQEF